jgi:hypothetical protein
MATGDRLTLGSLTVSGIEPHPLQVPPISLKPGYIESPTAYFGVTSLLGLNQGALNIGMSAAPFALYCVAGTNNLFAGSTTKHVGEFTSTGITVALGAEFRTVVGSLQLNGTHAELIGGSTLIAASQSVDISGGAGGVTISGPDVFIQGESYNAKSKFWDSKKPFDILHPTKEGHRLRYVCLEGPSAEVYYRGTLKNSNVIDLPEYWKGLVDQETIGVTLTPIGTYQELFWEKIEWGSRIVIKNNAGSSIHCHYVIYGERKDTSKNITEYQGLTPMDYPGDNREYNLNS